MAKKKVKNVGLVFLGIGILYLLSPFDLPGPIDDAVAMGAASIIKVICDWVSFAASEKLAEKKAAYVEA